MGRAKLNQLCGSGGRRAGVDHRSRSHACRATPADVEYGDSDGTLDERLQVSNQSVMSKTDLARGNSVNEPESEPEVQGVV